MLSKPIEIRKALNISEITIMENRSGKKANPNKGLVAPKKSPARKKVPLKEQKKPIGNNWLSDNKTSIKWFFFSLPLSISLVLITWFLTGFILLDGGYLQVLLDGGYLQDSELILMFVLGSTIVLVVGLYIGRSMQRLRQDHKSYIRIRRLCQLGVIFIILATLVAVYFFKSQSPSPPLVRKPAIYLYPETDSIINVTLEVNGKITETIPDYNGLWSVFVTKEGIIDGKYDYLYYESEMRHFDIRSEGWCIKTSELGGWFSKMLPRMGLNEKETEQFKEYWLECLSDSDYYEIRLVEDSWLEKDLAVNISPKPEVFIRLIFYIKGHDREISLPEPKVLIPERKGFVAVEWGGILG
jgi:hypothetical protein